MKLSTLINALILLVILVSSTFKFVIASGDNKEHTMYYDTKDFSPIITTLKEGRLATITPKITLKGSYTKGNNMPYKVKIISEKSNGIIDEENKSSSREMSFDEPLDINLFVKQLGDSIIKYLLDEKGNDSIKNIKRESIMEIYVWLSRAANGFDEENISGILHMNTFVKTYKGNEDRIPVNKINEEYYTALDKNNLNKWQAIININDSLLATIDYKTKAKIYQSYAGKYIKLETAASTITNLFDKEKKINDELVQSFLKKDTKNREQWDIISRLIKYNNSTILEYSKDPRIDRLKVVTDSLRNILEIKKTNLDLLVSYINSNNKDTILTSELKEKLKSYEIDTNLIISINNQTAINNNSNNEDAIYTNAIYINNRRAIKIQLDKLVDNYLNPKKKSAVLINIKSELRNDKIVLDDLINALHRIELTETMLNNLLGEKQYKELSKITNIKLQIENGFIENVQVTLEDNENPLMTFENTFPIGFSSIYNYDNFDDIILYIRSDEHDIFEDKYLYLSEIFPLYENLLENNRRDFSCADFAINNLEPSKTPIISLSKEQSINLFDTRIYTDFFGLSDKNPNGLVQTEVRRRFNLFTQRYEFSQLVNIGYVNFLIPYINITKLEDKERYLLLRNNRNFVNNQLSTPSYASTIDFIKYEALAIGMETNIITLGVPNGKMVFYLDMGTRYSRVPVIDSTRNIINNEYRSELLTDLPPAGLVTWYPKLSAEIKSDNRLGFDLNFMLNNTTLLGNNLYKAVASYSKSNTDIYLREKNSRWTEAFEFNVRYLPDHTNPGNKVFVRFKITWQLGDINTFYPQFQFGYSYKLKYKL